MRKEVYAQTYVTFGNSGYLRPNLYFKTLNKMSVRMNLFKVQAASEKLHKFSPRLFGLSNRMKTTML
jgi:hypothetical protein